MGFLRHDETETVKNRKTKENTEVRKVKAINWKIPLDFITISTVEMTDVSREKSRSLPLKYRKSFP